MHVDRYNGDPNEGKEAAAGLQGHPGFLWLCRQLKLEAATLDARLRQLKHNDLSEVTALQAGIFWLTYLENRIEMEVFKAREALNHQPKTPLNEEQDAFNKVNSAIELLK